MLISRERAPLLVVLWLSLGTPQEKRLRGLGAAIPQHAAREAKREREWKEFLDRPTPAPEASAAAAAQRVAGEVC